MNTYQKVEAVVSEDGFYRYFLSRYWGTPDPRNTVLFVMLNPSVADGTKDDPTIRKCVGFAKKWSYTGINVVNVYAWRATDPRELKKQGIPKILGPENFDHVRRAIATTSLHIAAWGTHLRTLPFDIHMLLQKHPLQCLGTTKDGQPRHPLMVAYETPLEGFHLPSR